MQKNNRSAQSITGFVMIFVIVIATLLVMSKYVRNSMSNKVRQAGDSLGGGAQYDPGPGYGPFSTGASTSGTKD